MCSSDLFGYQYARAIGTPYVYDMMFNSSFPALVDLAVDAWSASAWSYSGNVGVFGFEFSVSTTGIGFVGFDPYSLALDVGMMILSSMLSCSQDEQMLALKRGQNLCVFQKSECTEKLPIFGTCITTTNTYCCYNSILAKIVATGANAQLGRGLSCAGFTPDDLAKVNFAAINFSEFIASVAPRARGSLPSVNYAKDKINSYYGK